MQAQPEATIPLPRPTILIAGTVVLLALVAVLALRPTPRNDLRRADDLFAAGHFYAARAAYATLADRWPTFAPAWLRLGIVATLRNEPISAEHAFAAALRANPQPADTNLIRLYQGQLAARVGQTAQARQYWGQIDTNSALVPAQQLLNAELLLNQGDYAEAEASYRRALASRALPGRGRVLASTRLALLRAASDPTAASALLAAIPPTTATSHSELLDPLLPPANPSATEISAALAAPAEQRPQLLGQLYLGARLYALAEAQFASVGPENPNALAAAAYAAYTRWSAGDRAEGLRRLQALAEQYPNEPRARALLALALLNNNDDAAARRELEAVRTLAPNAPDTHLAWGQWYVAQHDYVAAAEAYRLALRDAPAEQRGNYALALAQFYVATGFRLCENGRDAANTATALLPSAPQAWAALAAARLSCGDASGTRAAANQALQLSPSEAEASYYLGRALAALGERDLARQAFIQAADSAPASGWRTRAEQQIAALGL